MTRSLKQNREALESYKARQERLANKRRLSRKPDHQHTIKNSTKALGNNERLDSVNLSIKQLHLRLVKLEQTIDLLLTKAVTIDAPKKDQNIPANAVEHDVADAPEDELLFSSSSLDFSEECEVDEDAILWRKSKFIKNESETKQKIKIDVKKRKQITDKE